MHLTIFLFNLMGLKWYAGGSRFWVWGRGEDGSVLYLFYGVSISLVLFSLPCSAFSYRDATCGVPLTTVRIATL